MQAEQVTATAGRNLLAHRRRNTHTVLVLGCCPVSAWPVVAGQLLLSLCKSANQHVPSLVSTSTSLPLPPPGPLGARDAARPGRHSAS